MTLWFSVLGPPEVRGNGGEVAIEEPRARTLFAALVVNANTPVTIDRLAQALWETVPRNPLAELETVEEELRRILRSAGELADGRLLRRGYGHLLAVAVDELDLDRFALLFRQGRAALEAEDHYAAAHLLGHGLTIWRGPAGAGAQAYGWLRRRLDEIDELRSLAIEGHLLARLALGQSDQVIEDARRLLATEPLDERWWACLVASLRDAGKSEAAQAVHDQARQVYMEGLGLLPDHIHRLLHLALLPPQLRASAHWMTFTANRMARRNGPSRSTRWTKPGRGPQDLVRSLSVAGPVADGYAWPPADSARSDSWPANRPRPD